MFKIEYIHVYLLSNNKRAGRDTEKSSGLPSLLLTSRWFFRYFLNLGNGDN